MQLVLPLDFLLRYLYNNCLPWRLTFGYLIWAFQFEYLYSQKTLQRNYANPFYQIFILAFHVRFCICGVFKMATFSLPPLLVCTHSNALFTTMACKEFWLENLTSFVIINKITVPCACKVPYLLKNVFPYLTSFHPY